LDNEFSYTQGNVQGPKQQLRVKAMMLISLPLLYMNLITRFHI